MAGLFSVALVVVRSLERPEVIRLVALWCSDFPLAYASDCPTCSIARQLSITKINEH